MTDFIQLLNLASRLASDRGATVQEILASEEFDYSSRSSIYNDFTNISKYFGMNVWQTDERGGKTGREVYHHIDVDEWNRFRSHFIQKILSDDDRRLLSFMLESMGSVSPLIAASDKGFLSRLKELVGNITINPVSSKGYFALPDVKNLLLLLKAQEEEGFLYITYKGEKRKLYPLKCFISAGGVYCYVMMENGFVYKISIPRIEEISCPLTKAKNEKRPMPAIDIEKKLSDPFSIVDDHAEFTAVIKLSIDQGWIEEEKDWPDSVTIEEKEDCYLFTVRTCGAYWLERWVLSLGPAAEVIEPEFLRKKISGDVKKVAEMYK